MVVLDSPWRPPLKDVHILKALPSGLCDTGKDIEKDPFLVGFKVLKQLIVFPT